MSEEKVLDFAFDNKEIQVPGVYVKKMKSKSWLILKEEKRYYKKILNEMIKYKRQGNAWMLVNTK